MEDLWAPKEIACITGADITKCQPITGISTDSRTVRPGDLYIPLKGTRFDGHDYIQEALLKGASAALSEKKLDSPIFIVPNTFDALKKLAISARTRSEARILAVTGSAGKTTTKEALGYILSKQALTWVTPKSYNNHWGVPISLAGLHKSAKFAVFELGMNNPGEIQPLAKMVRPHVAFITTILPAHIGRMGSLQAIANAKAEVFDGLPNDGLVILNSDDEMFAFMKQKAVGHNVITFGKNASADYHLLNVKTENNQFFVSAEIYGKKINYILPFTGEHWPVLSLGWLACVEALGGDVWQAAEDLAGFELLSGRGQIIELLMPGGKVIIIDESYNANPCAMELALDRLKTYNDRCIRRRIAVLGDMAELGADEQKEHIRLVQCIKGTNIDIVHGSGILVKPLIEALPEAIQGQVIECSKDLATILQQDVRPGDLYMIKGSRGGGVKPRMQYVVDAIKEAADLTDKKRNFS